MKAEGVDILFAYPVNPLIEAAAAEDIRTVIVRQERIGLHMADAYSRVTSGRARSACSACSMAPEPRTPSAASRRRSPSRCRSWSSRPAIPRRLAHYYPNFNSSLNMRHVTKWAEPLTMGRAIPEVMRRAFFQLRNGRPGPVLIEVPVDVWGEDVPDGWVHTADLHGEERAGPGGRRRGGTGACRPQSGR